MSASARVSVVIPTYNCAPFLAAALDSVLAQTYRDFETIVVDDGSTDDTREVIQAYRDRITYLSRANRGAAAARNTGVQASRGDIVSFLDADDLWHPEKLAEEVALFDGHPEVGVSFTNFTFFGAPTPWPTGFDERDAALRRYPSRPIGPGRHLIISPSLVEDFLRHQAYPKPSMLAVRRGCLDRVGPFDEALQICEDTQMFLRLARHCTFAYIDRCLVQRRVRQDTLSSAADDLRYAAVHIQLFDTLDRWITLSPAEHGLARRAVAGYRLAAGYTHFSRGELSPARHHLRASLRARFSVKALRYLCLASAPSGLLRGLRARRHRRARQAPVSERGARPSEGMPP